MEVDNMKSISKKRGQNWLDEDKHLLQALVRERVIIIENKNTDTNTNKKKKSAWENIHNSFNSICTGTKRTIAQLKTQWGMQKMQEKKEKAMQRREIFRTGGGAPPALPNCKIEDIASWLPNEFVVDSNEFDSDTINNSILVIDSATIETNTGDVLASDVVDVQQSTSAVETPLDEDKENVRTNFKRRTLNTACKTPSKRKNKVNVPETNCIAMKSIEAIASREIERKDNEHELEMQNKMKQAKLLNIQTKLAKAKLKLFRKKHPTIDLSSDED